MRIITAHQSAEKTIKLLDAAGAQVTTDITQAHTGSRTKNTHVHRRKRTTDTHTHAHTDMHTLTHTITHTQINEATITIKDVSDKLTLGKLNQVEVEVGCKNLVQVRTPKFLINTHSHALPPRAVPTIAVST